MRLITGKSDSSKTERGKALPFPVEINRAQPTRGFAKVSRDINILALRRELDTPPISWLRTAVQRASPTAFSFPIRKERKRYLHLSISGWPRGDRILCEQKPKDQLGFDVVRFAEMKVMRSFLIPAHQLTGATISSDGKYVACNGLECGKYVEFVVVYDVKSGREIARRKLDPVHDMAFVPGKTF